MKTAHFLFSHWCTVVHTEVLGSPTKICWMSKPSVGGKEFRCIISRPASERWQWPLGGQSCLPYLRAVIFLLTTPSGSFLYDSFLPPQRRAFRSFVSVLIAQKKRAWKPGWILFSRLLWSSLLIAHFPDNSEHYVFQVKKNSKSRGTCL